MTTENLRERNFRRVVESKLEPSEVQLPEWVQEFEEEEFSELLQICAEALKPDQLLDLLDAEYFEQALALIFSFLLDNGHDPEEYLLGRMYYPDSDTENVI